MTPYREAWLTLISQRDFFYLQIAAAVVVGLVWYRLWLWRRFRLMLIGAGLVILAGLYWGLVQLEIGDWLWE